MHYAWMIVFQVSFGRSALMGTLENVYRFVLGGIAGGLYMYMYIRIYTSSHIVVISSDGSCLIV